MINRNRKGKVGERDCRDLLRDFGYEAHRGQQHAGGIDSPDIIHDIPGVHVEVKRMEAYDPYRWIRQAVADGRELVPVVFHRRNRKEWLVIMRAEDFLRTFAPPPSGEW
jgi:hypothetical protein